MKIINHFKKEVKWGKNGIIGLVTGILSVNLLNTLDYMTTTIAIPLGASELNPIIDTVIHNGWLFPIKVVIGGLLLTYILIRSYRKYGKTISLSTSLLMTLIFGAIVMNNFVTILKLI